MKRILGVVAEYNPLHGGHYYQMHRAIQETQSRYVVIAMSGNFVQRGEPAIFDKWTRAQMALAAGADLVVEIPTYFVLQSAQGYAQASMDLLAKCGVTHISFGSEAGKIADLMAMARWLNQEQTQTSIRQALRSGISYAAAIQKVAEQAPQVAPLASLFHGANNILAIEYLRALPQDSAITVHTVQRVGQPRGKENGQYPSASVLRQLLNNGNDISPYIPHPCRPVFDMAVKRAGPIYARDLSQAVFYALTTMTPQEIYRLPACSEGLENRIRQALNQQRDLGQFQQAVKSKRYPLTRVQRLCMQALLRFDEIETTEPVPYARVLACSARGKELLPQLAQQTALIYSARDVKELSPTPKSMLELDLRAADIYNLALPPHWARRDIVQQPAQ